MAGSNRQMNWRAVSFTPMGGSPIAIDGVQSIDFDPQARPQMFAGDQDRGPTTIVVPEIENLITLVSGNIQTLRSFAPGDRGAFVATHVDAKRGTTGDVTLAVANPGAVIINNPFSGSFRAFGQGRLIINTEWSDGATNPVSTTVDTTP